MKSRLLRWLAIFLILETGLLHYVRAQSQYTKADYLGYLAVGSGILALISALLVHKEKILGWVLGLVLALGSIVGFVLTRTVALPGLAVEPWVYPYEIVGVVAEGLFILLFLAVRPWKPVPTEVEMLEVPRSRFGWLLPATSLILVGVVLFATYEWDIFARQISYHVHVGSVNSVCRTPVTSFDELEEKYGIKIMQMNISMLDSVVDVRLMVVDSEKAQALLQNQAALLIDQQVLILAPHQHTHGNFVQGLPHIMFFSTQKNTVHSGSEVSLVLGRVRVEPLIMP